MSYNFLPSILIFVSTLIINFDIGFTINLLISKEVYYYRLFLLIVELLSFYFWYNHFLENYKKENLFSETKNKWESEEKIIKQFIEEDNYDLNINKYHGVYKLFGELTDTIGTQYVGKKEGNTLIIKQIN